MRIHYLLADFGGAAKVRSPLGGTLGGPKIAATEHLTLYRDMDVDPHTLVAEAGGKVYHYPWASVQVAVLKPEPVAEKVTKKAS